MPTFGQDGSFTYEEGDTSHATPLPPPSPPYDTTDAIQAFLHRLHLRMDDFEQKFDRIEVHQSRFDQFMFDYQQSQYYLCNTPDLA